MPVVSGFLPALPQRQLLCCLGLSTAALAAAMLFRRQVDSYDTDIMAQVTRSLLTDGTFQVQRDPFGFNSPYASYGLGMSLVFAGPYWVATQLHRDPAIWLMASNAGIFALTAAAVFGLTLGCGATARQGAISCVLVCFGTLLFPYASTGLSEPAVGLGVAIGLASVSVASTQRSMIACGVAGAASGLTVLMRTDSLLLVVPILAVGAWYAAGRRSMAIMAFGVAAAPWLLVVAGYNTLRFGVPWQTGYAGISFNHPILTGLYGLTLSPGAGLLWYMPLVVIAVLGLPRAVQRRPVVTLTAIALLAIRLPFYACLFTWWGGGSWGPRYLVPAIPALTVGIVEIVRGFPTAPLAMRVAAPTIAVISILVQLPGAAVNSLSTRLGTVSAQLLPPHPRTDFNELMANPRVEATFDSYLFDWHYFPMIDQVTHLLHAHHLAGLYFTPSPHVRKIALFCGLLALALALVWRASRPTPLETAHPAEVTIGHRQAS